MSPPRAWNGLSGDNDRFQTGMSSGAEKTCGAEKTRRLESRRGRLKACSTLLIPIALLAAQTAPVYDVVITGGRIVDGAGNPWFTGDVGIQGDTIAYVGPAGRARGRLTLDAKVLIVAPGFIDTHSHARRGIFESPAAENQIRQGVTTLIEGPDGSSPLPLKPFLDKLAVTRFSVNFGMLVGQGSIRQQVIGLKDRKATTAEVAAMKELARQAMLDGAFGLSTGLFYLPGAFTPTGEVIEIAKVTGAMGGIHTSHMRDEAASVLDSVRETIRIGEEGGLPTQVTHHKIIGRANWGRSVETLRLVEDARARGVDVTIDQYPYTASSTGTAAMFPRWSLESGNAALIERLGAPEQRARIVAEIADRIENDRGGGDPRNVVMASCSFDAKLAGKNLAELTAARGVPVTFASAAETAIELQRQGGCSAVYHAISEEDLERILRYPFTMIASDGGIPMFGEDVPHPRNYGTFARVLGRYVRERKTLSLEDAIRRMTSLPASRFRVFDRGLLRPGMKADVAVFDSGAVIDKADFVRPHQYAEGFRHVLVNGKLVLVDGKMTGERPGRVLYGPAHDGR
jgi:N-acyl-D-amino-acid deacylase